MNDDVGALKSAFVRFWAADNRTLSAGKSGPRTGRIERCPKSPKQLFRAPWRSELVRGVEKFIEKVKEFLGVFVGRTEFGMCSSVEVQLC